MGQGDVGSVGKGTSSNPTPRVTPRVTPAVTPRVTPIGDDNEAQRIDNTHKES